MVTIDTNIAFYALVRGNAGTKEVCAKAILKEVHFLSVQVLNEYACAARRKLRRDWVDIERDLELLRYAVVEVRPIDALANREALRIAERYQLAFFDALMIAVALGNDATVLYSEDMQHGLVVDGALTITNPFLSTGPQ